MKQVTTGAWIKDDDGMPMLLDGLTTSQLHAIMCASLKQIESLEADVVVIQSVITQRQTLGGN